MEGKAVLFKRFADIDSIDLEVDTEDADEFINAVRYLGPSFGGINLEDIKAPECFIIEQRLRELMDIPVFHDDQHGTAIIAAAGLINALELTGRDIQTTRLVVNGAGAAGIACTELLKAMGFKPDNVILCDTKGVIYQGRTRGHEPVEIRPCGDDRRAHAGRRRSTGADVFFGLSAEGRGDAGHGASMAPNPIIFAMANPDPEITPEEVHAVRDDAIMATGRSDYPNQVNNVLGFPYIFRGALDVRANTINMEMKIAAAEALAIAGARGRARRGRRRLSGRPAALRPGLHHPRALRSAPDPRRARRGRQGGDGDRRRPQADRRHDSLQGSVCRLVATPSPARCNRIFERVRRYPKRVVFAEGEEEQVIRAAMSFVSQDLGHAILVGREERINETAAQLGVDLAAKGIDHRTMPGSRIATQPMRSISMNGCSGRAISSATASA